MTSPVSVGIPQSLGYFHFARIWDEVFASIGVGLVYSGPTTKTVVDLGVEHCVNEACLPMKLLHGQVASLLHRVDLVFLPRLVSIGGGTVFCPKFLGLPDMIRATFGDQVELLSPRIDLREGFLPAISQVAQLARRLGVSAVRAAAAYTRAVISMRCEKACQLQAPRGEAGGPVVGVLGYPYLVEDEYANMGLLKKLSSLGARVVKITDVPEERLKVFDSEFDKQVFWYYSDRVVKTGYYLCRNSLVDGLIHVTAFGCGPDAIADKLLELEAKRCGVPYLTISVDECTGEAGVQTRAEAFVDMLRRRRGGSL